MGYEPRTDAADTYERHLQQGMHLQDDWHR
jgi:hypothetical protein